ncbi:alpha/beta hydrolase [Mycobacterium deserti]|uniref:Alpha/beta hydrolase n=1 Tax=Mycobacterium deserti TaxID=2978347 RepID=A0ABT2M7K4_9MYCO|nr:alpha/beta hydrolase [Mycobacterium deserti]MCT7658248.1 alpha/beta hydrolase [Mycobacterium deserti]
MVDRFLVWFGVCLATAWMSTAALIGAGVAAAEDDSGPDGTTSSESADSPDSQQDSTKPNPEAENLSNDPADSKDPAGPKEKNADETEDAGETEGDVDEEEAGEEEPGEEEPVEEPAANESTGKKDGSDTVETGSVTPKRNALTVENGTADEGQQEKAATVETEAETEAGELTVDPVLQAVERQSVNLDIPAADLIDAPEVAAVAFAAAPSAAAASAAATAPPLTVLLDVIGTVVFNLYALATRLIGGPAVLPPGSNVTVRSSTLRIDCGCADGQGFDVPADWYIPETEEGEEPPQRLIYLQHGFLASGPWYSHTAAALAEQTNSIVVAPSITSNFLDAEACWLGAAPMHEALAKLFDADNTALADSALAAGYTGAIPSRVVLMGHSLGGGAVSGMAGYMTDNETDGRLAGVVLLDGVGLNGAMAADLDKVSLSIPIYQLAAPRYFWNQDGVGTTALLQARPGEYVGVTLVGGSHVDSMRGGNPLIQFSQQLVSGFSTPQNVAAAQQIMVGWVNDMFSGDQATGLYEDDLDEPISTPAGDAIAVALPNSLTKPFFLNFLQPFVSLGDGLFTFDPACVAASTGRSASGSCSASLAA